MGDHPLGQSWGPRTHTMFALVAAATGFTEELKILPHRINRRLNADGDQYLNPVSRPCNVKENDSGRPGGFDAGVWGSKFGGGKGWSATKATMKKLNYTGRDDISGGGFLEDKTLMH